ncbi:MAG: glycoside hydrolase [Planctomycetaceae bacterium]|nr:glycoside hydrolase [Planctomycetaceae bacterium]
MFRNLVVSLVLVLIPGFGDAADTAVVFEGNLQPLTENEKTALSADDRSLFSDFDFPEEVSPQILFRKGKENDGYNNIRIPAICMSKQGTLLAFAEGRVAGDTGKIEMLLRRSEDCGKTWSPIQVIWKDGDNTCGNPTPVCDMETGTIWLLTTWNHGLDHEGQIMDGQSQYPRIPHVLKSDDDGKTWSDAKPLSHLRKDNWGWYATGPCNGIQLTRGPHKGRLVIPANHSVVDLPRPRSDLYHSHIIYSDDHGTTWKLGGMNETLTNESTVVELTDGGVMQNMRSYHGRDGRAVAISRDGGETMPTLGLTTGKPGDDAYLDLVLHSPVCQASILRYDWPENGQPGTILYSGPWGTARSRLAVWMSRDDGKTWSHRQRIYNGPAAYSNLIALPDGQIGLLAEIGTQTPYDTISFLTFPLSWIASAEKPENPNPSRDDP